jgi:hypothetical protein
VFGFPQFYGKNMDAWIDCMSSLDSPEDGLTTVHCNKGDFFVIELINAIDFKKRCPEQFDAFIDCSAFVNYRNIEIGMNPLLMLSFYL